MNNRFSIRGYRGHCVSGSLGAPSRRAQSLVEFALLVPVFLAILMGIMEFGILTKNSMQLSSAAREGARAAAIGKTTAEITTKINQLASPLPLTSPNGSIQMLRCDSNGSNCTAWPADNTSVTPARNGVAPPNMVRIVLTSRHRSLTGFIPGLNNRMLNATVTMRREA